jgi:hypothetical protein
VSSHFVATLRRQGRTDILLGKAGATDPKLVLPYLGQHVAVRERVICPDSGIRFTLTPDFVFPVC